jgi:monovalent cation:H+ antiporter-2, CPA2 family
VVALVAVGRGHIGEGLLGVVAMVVVLSLTLAPALSSDRITRLLTRGYPSAAPRRDEPPRGHVLLIGVGQGGAALLERLRSREIAVVVVDDDPAIVAQLTRDGIRAIRGEGGDPEVLAAAGAAQAVAVVSTMRRLEDNAALLACCAGRPVLVRVFSEEEAEEIRSRGGHPIVEAALAEDAFFGFYERLAAGDRG